jgi:2-polyprenyl-6-methoxyphenol hydroxylase-like FAD-dependent oxidoreductase
MVQKLETECCIAGGGPAGMMLGLLLARAGIETIVLEKHADFLRDFRGDTIHPSTMQVINELGYLDDFLLLPHQQVFSVTGQFGEYRVRLADFSKLKVRAPFIAMMPQWDFLSFLITKAKPYPNFKLMMRTEADGLLGGADRRSGVTAICPAGPLEIRARLTIAADGRSSTLRQAAALAVDDLGAPLDVLWFRLSRQASDTSETQGRFDAGRITVMLNRGEYWQCAFVIPKGAYEKVHAAGLNAFRDSLRSLLPFNGARADEIESWDQLKLLEVQVNRLPLWWQPGFLCIGDAAHAMSPVGGVGINLAIQDAVAAANILAAPLQSKTLTDDDLAAVQARRMWPTQMTQRLQVAIQNQIISSALTARGTFKPPFALRVLTAVPGLNRLPARLMGLGFQPEHVSNVLKSSGSTKH